MDRDQTNINGNGRQSSCMMLHDIACRGAQISSFRRILMLYQRMHGNIMEATQSTAMRWRMMEIWNKSIKHEKLYWIYWISYNLIFEHIQ
jgi:hypothetical protein